MAKVAIPSVGIAMTEALLLKWLKEPGDEVASAEPVALIETDKATMELESPTAGRLGPHLVDEGAIVAVGTVIVEVDGQEADPGAPAAVLLSDSEPVAARSPSPTVSSPSPDGSETRLPHTTSPRARRLARARDDAPPAAGRFRDLIAAKVTQSWRDIPHFAVTREIDAESMLGELERLRASGVAPTPTFTDLLLRALALGLRERGVESDDVGLAVATAHGVLIPVVRGVLSRNEGSVAASRLAAVERARAGQLNAEDLAARPTSTLSNLGALGVDQFTGIIALGQTSLLTVGRAIPRVVASGNPTLSVKSTFHATLNVDHRTIDGAEAAALLVAFTDAAEQMGRDRPENDGHE